MRGDMLDVMQPMQIIFHIQIKGLQREICKKDAESTLIWNVVVPNFATSDAHHQSHNKKELSSGEEIKSSANCTLPAIPSLLQLLQYSALKTAFGIRNCI